MKKTFTLLGILVLTAFSNAQIVINEIYGGGGSIVSTTVYKYDYIELKNIGTTTVTLTGAYIKYAGSLTTFNNSNSHSLPDITLAPGQTFLIREGTTSTSAGADLPVAPDATGNIALAAVSGKVALTSDSTNPTSATDANVLDFVGYGSANLYEGSAAAASPSNSLSISRISGDTNNNSVDFATGAPTPQNSTGTLAITDIKRAELQFVKNTLVKTNHIVFGADVENIKIYNMLGQIVKVVSGKENQALDVSELVNGNYIVTGTINNKDVSQKILKD